MDGVKGFMVTPTVLWITSNPAEEIFHRARLALATVDNLAEGLAQLETIEYDVVVVSYPFAEQASIGNVVEVLQQTQPNTPIVLRAPGATPTEIVQYLRLGIYHVLTQADGTSLLVMAANSKWAAEKALRSSPAHGEPWRNALVGESRAMEQVAQRIRLVAPRRSTVLITGETGTGKELVARALHAASGRARSEMVSVNCSALPETLLEAELFGHIRGAFTGAMNQRVGRFEQAHKGTIFLDEIGDMPISLQAKLLRVLQEREFQRLGSSETIHVDVRVIAATHADLKSLIQQGKFREDLYYRLSVVPIVMPPLRERETDIALLIRHFIDKVCREEGIPAKEIPRETIERLARYDWPGNVRQLENAVEQAIVLSGDRACLYPGDFALSGRAPVMRPGAQPYIAVPDHGLDFERTVGTIERNILEQALQKTGGNKKLAAEMLGLKRTTLSAKLKSLVAVGAAS